MGKKKKGKKGYRIAAVAIMLLAVLPLMGCESLRRWAEGVPDPAEPGQGDPPAGPQVPGPGGGVPVDVLDIAVWVLAAMGLLPAARLVGASRPLIAPLITMLLGPSKKAKEAQAADGVHKP